MHACGAWQVEVDAMNPNIIHGVYCGVRVGVRKLTASLRDFVDWRENREPSTMRTVAVARP